MADTLSHYNIKLLGLGKSDHIHPFARPQRLACTKGAGMGKRIMHCRQRFTNAQSQHASHSTLRHISMHCIQSMSYFLNKNLFK